MTKLLQIPGALVIGVGALFFAWGWESPPADSTSIMLLGTGITAAGGILYGLGAWGARWLNSRIRR